MNETEGTYSPPNPPPTVSFEVDAPLFVSPGGEVTAIFLAGAEVETLTNALLEGGVQNILYSFFYIHTMKRYAFIEKVQRENPHIRFFLDSGAFTYFQKAKDDSGSLPPIKVYKKLYFDYVASTWPRWARVAELDVDGAKGVVGVDYNTVVEWREEMLERWPKAPITPVWHMSRGSEEWTLHCRDPRTRYLAIGSGMPWVGKHRKMVLEAHRWNKSVHGFGFTRMNTALPYIPYDTVDSTTWLMGQKYGTIYIFMGHKIIALDKTSKSDRRKYRSYFRNIGCDPYKIEADDVHEVRKANVIAWRNISAYLEWAERRKGRTIRDSDIEAKVLPRVRHPEVPAARPLEREEEE